MSPTEGPTEGAGYQISIESIDPIATHCSRELHHGPDVGGPSFPCMPPATKLTCTQRGSVPISANQYPVTFTGQLASHFVWCPSVVRLVSQLSQPRRHLLVFTGRQSTRAAGHAHDISPRLFFLRQSLFFYCNSSDSSIMQQQLGLNQKRYLRQQIYKRSDLL